MLAMLTASSAAKTAVKARSSASRVRAAGVGFPAASASRPVSWESTMLHAKFCGPARRCERAAPVRNAQRKRAAQRLRQAARLVRDCRPPFKWHSLAH